MPVGNDHQKLEEGNKSKTIKELREEMELKRLWKNVLESSAQKGDQ